ncbi:hypothetical protein GCM10009540_27390 [Streptomyces turgidiscabies]
MLDGDEDGVDPAERAGRLRQPGRRVHGRRELPEEAAADADSAFAERASGVVPGQADHAVTGTGEQGGEQAADAARAEYGKGERGLLCVYVDGCGCVRGHG